MADTEEPLIDPILTELRKVREDIAARFGHDVRRYAEYLNEQSLRSGRNLVSLPPRRPSTMPPAA